jgi:hypothetical protein
MVLSHIDQQLEVHSKGWSEVSTLASVCMIVYQPAASLAVMGGGRSFTASDVLAWLGLEAMALARL